MSIKILIVDDNVDILSNIRDYLEFKGYLVDTATTAVSAYDKIERDHMIDLVILDVGLPDFDGYHFCRMLRRQHTSIPVLMLTARDSIDDRVEGLNAGADDYVVKPFSLRELSARVEALLRRAFGGHAAILTIADLSYNLKTQTVYRAGIELKLNPTGLKLLRILMVRSPAVISREELETLLWNGNLPSSDSLRSNLYLLRQAVDKPFDRALIHTHAGLGWSLREE